MLNRSNFKKVKNTSASFGCSHSTDDLTVVLLENHFPIYSDQLVDPVLVDPLS